MISHNSDFAVQGCKGAVLTGWPWSTASNVVAGAGSVASNHMAPIDSPLPRNSSPLSSSLDRLIAIAGRPLSDRQQRDQTERIFRLSHNPEEQRKFEQIRRKCTGQILKLLAKRTCV
jgi:hypothetical protein